MAWIGLAPYLPAHRPRAVARWWVACGYPIILDECTEPPGAINGPFGLAAPISLPQEFMAYLDRLEVSPHDVTANRLFAHARKFARQRERGKRHPKRFAEETLSALDRRRLPLYHASLPLLAHNPIEVDVTAYLQQFDLPHTGLGGATPDAIRRRREVVRGLKLEIIDEDLVIASYDALRALVAFAAVA
jgi:hypothetical protein